MFYYGYDPTYILVIIGFLITLIAQIFVNSSYKKYKIFHCGPGAAGRNRASGKLFKIFYIFCVRSKI